MRVGLVCVYPQMKVGARGRIRTSNLPLLRRTTLPVGLRAHVLSRRRERRRHCSWYPHPDSNRDWADFKSAGSTRWPMRASAKKLVPLAGFEPATSGPSDQRLYLLAHRGMLAGRERVELPRPFQARAVFKTGSVTNRIACPQVFWRRGRDLNPHGTVKASRVSNAVPLPSSLSDYPSAARKHRRATSQLEYRPERLSRLSSRSVWRVLCVIMLYE